MRKTVHFFVFLGALAKLMAQDPFVFEEQNGLAIIETGSATSYGLWSPDTLISGYLGDHYLVYQGANFYNSPGNSLLTYKIHISKTGKYRIQWRSRITIGTSNTDNNDSWLRMGDASKFYAQKSSSILYPHGSGMSPNPAGAGSNGWFKIYQNVLNNWTWNTSTNDNNPYDIYAEFDSIGIYTIEISGRSNGHAVDRIVLYHSDINASQALGLSLPESPKSVLSSINKESRELNIFPNPAKDYLHISIPELIPRTVSTFTIRDVSGRIMKKNTQRISTREGVTIQLEGIPPGLYFLVIETESIVYKGEFVKL